MSTKAVLLGLAIVATVVVGFLAVSKDNMKMETSPATSVQVLPENQVNQPVSMARTSNGEQVSSLLKRIAQLRRERDAERAKVARLQAQIRALSRDGKTAPKVELRPSADVKVDLKELAKGEGLNILKLSNDHPLLKELAAMGPEGIQVLGDLLKTGTNDERLAAAALMSRLKDADAVPLLAEAVLAGDNEDNVMVQRVASHALAKIGGEKAVPALEQILTDASDWGVRTNAAASLAEMGLKSGIDWIRETYVGQKDSTVKLTLLGVMSHIGDPSYLPELHSALRTETEYSKRYLAVKGISKAARQESLPVLEAIINNPDEDKMLINVAKKAYDELKGDE